MEHEETSFIHRYVPARSPENGESTYTLLLLHGTGGNENDLLDLGRMIAPGAAQLSPRGKVLEHDMPRFFRRVAEGVFDVEDLQQRTYELADFIEAAAKHYHFDPRKVIAVGFSNGANIAGSLLLLRPNVLAGAILLHPMVPFIPETLPDLSNVPVFIGAGRADPIALPIETERLTALLKETHAQVTVRWQPGGHTISLDEVRGMMEWIRQFTKQ
jgi:predicted esterase